MPSRVPIIDASRCQPTRCRFECGLVCPKNRSGSKCVELVSDIEDVAAPGKRTARVNESLCIGCGLCANPNRGCPFGAVKMVNIPTELASVDQVHRYGENGFRLYRLPVLTRGKVIGLVGQNGIGKSTLLSILALP